MKYKLLFLVTLTHICTTHTFNYSSLLNKIPKNGSFRIVAGIVIAPVLMLSIYSIKYFSEKQKKALEQKKA